MPKILIVDENDRPIDSATFEDARAKGLIHCISEIFVFNSKGQLLLQKRGSNVLSPNLWDDSVGGHVDEGEDYEIAAKREAKEELGLTNMTLKPIKTYYTEEHLPNAIIKRFNRLFVAQSDDKVHFNSKEISEVKYVSLSDLDKWLKLKPEEFDKGFIKTYEIYKQNK